MSEREKMLAGQLYNHYDKQLTTERKEIAEKVFTYNGTRELDKQQELLPTMLGKVGNNVEIKIPFMCDYGYNIEIVQFTASSGRHSVLERPFSETNGRPFFS